MGKRFDLFYRHLGNGTAFLIPLVVTTGILTIISYLWGLENHNYEGLHGAILSISNVGASLIVPVASGFIAYSIADKAGLVPGFLGGAFSYVIGAGFLGGILSGIICGYTALLLVKYLLLSRTLETFKFLVITPVITTLFIGLIMIYIVDPLSKSIYSVAEILLTNLACYSITLFGMVTGLLTAFDIGGVFSNVVSNVGSTLLGSNFGVPQACVFSTCMTVPTGMALAVSISKYKYSDQERQLGKVCWLFGVFGFMTGVIPFAVSDPIKVIPAIMIGSGISGLLTSLFGCIVAIEYGGLFALTVPGAITGIIGLTVSVTVGAVVIALLLKILKS
jgi:PTS system fructose-specific IIC component